MSPPDSRSKFRAHYRHYHRQRVEDPSWKTWIGEEDSPRVRRARRWRIFGILLGVLACAGLVAFLCFRMA